MFRLVGVLPVICVLSVVFLVQCSGSGDQSVLPSWKDTETRDKIIGFVEGSVAMGSETYIPPENRIAAFDLDGTIIVEKPTYFEVSASIALLVEMARKDPQLGLRQPYKAAVEGDRQYINSNIDEVITTAGNGMALKDYHGSVRDFLSTTRNPRLDNRSYDALVYAPVLEVIRYLQDNGFEVYIVSTSMQEYIRAFAGECLEVEGVNAVGSMIEFGYSSGPTSFPRSDDWWKPHNEGKGKVLRIRERTGGIPLFAMGNSGGDREMLTVTSNNGGLALLVNHDDPQRAYKYAKPGMLKLARKKGWTVISMKNDWQTVFAPACL